MANTLTFANRTITDAGLFGDIAYTADLNDGDEFTIGNTASASAEFVTDIQLPLYSKDTVNGTFTWTKDSTSKGRYYITEVTKEDGFYTVTAYDAMILLETNVSALSLTFPLSVSAAASAIATYIGCTVSGTIYNGSLSVSALDDNMTIRELLGYVAEASGCSVKIDGSDHLCFMYYDDSGITLTASDYKKINIADYSCTAIDRVTIFDSYGNLKAEAGSGDNALYIQGNPFLEEAQTAAAQAILDNVSGIVYTPLTCELFDEEGLEIGTMATFGTTQTLIMHLESSESGAMAQSVGSDTRAEYNKSIDIVANEARVLAEAALETAENTDQYFWMASTGSDTGVHITEIPREDFIADPQNGGGNIVARSNGIAVRDGLTELATFGASGATIGIPTEAHTSIDEDGMQIYTVNSNDTLVQLANIGYGQGQSASGTAVAPYYTFGTRASGSTIGNYSVAEGRNVQAIGYCSHACGMYTIADSGQFVIGYYNDPSNTGTFAIGTGLADDSRSTGFTIFSDDLGVEVRSWTEYPNTSVYVTKSTGTLISSRVNRFGMVVQLTLNFRNTSSTASGSDIFTGTLNKWRPTEMVTGATYFGGNALIGRISTAGTVTIRNASPSAVTISSSNSATISFTYITDDWSRYGE